MFLPCSIKNAVAHMDLVGALSKKTIHEAHVDQRVVGGSAGCHVDHPCGWQISPCPARSRWFFLEAQKPTQNPEIPKKHRVYKKVRANFSLILCDASQEPNGKRSKKLVLMNLFFLSRACKTMKCKLWTETLEFSRLKVSNSRFALHGLAPP